MEPFDISEYRIDSRRLTVYAPVVGEGTFGEIRRGSYKIPNGNEIEVVWKTLKKEQFDAVDDEMLVKEFRHQRALNHPNIVKTFGWASFRVDRIDTFGIIMEFVDGEDLDKIIKNSPYTAQQVFQWALQAAEGLKHMHSLPMAVLIHRDIKPENMLLNANRTVLKISDFGLSRELTSYANSVHGSPRYMAPEIFEGRSYNETCDVYSWAVSFHECFTRNVPFGDCARRSQLHARKIDSTYRLDPIPGVCERIQGLIELCTAHDRTERPTMDAVVDELLDIARQ